MNIKIVNSRVLPCGKCEACLKRKRLVEFNKLKSAFKRSAECFHVTLTYSNEYIDSISYSHVNKLIQSIRKDTNGLYGYYVVHEYGEKTGREHFHLLLFFRKSISLEYILKTLPKRWKYGFIFSRLSNSSNGFRYLTNYLFKGFGGVEDYKLRNFNSSKLLGYDGFFEENSYKDGKVYTGSWTYLPRAWKKRYHDGYISYLQSLELESRSLEFKRFLKKIIPNVVEGEVFLLPSHEFVKLDNGDFESHNGFYLRQLRELVKNEDFCVLYVLIHFVLSRLGFNFFDYPELVSYFFDYLVEADLKYNFSIGFLESNVSYEHLKCTVADSLIYKYLVSEGIAFPLSVANNILI